MIDICHSQGELLDIKFNAKSHVCLLFKAGNMFNDNMMDLLIGSSTIGWVSNLKYLGLLFLSEKHVEIDVCPFLHKFCASVNAIFTHSKFVHENVKLCLFAPFCLPLLTYELNAVFISRTQLNKLNAAWNNVYRKIFGFKQWESVRRTVSVW